MAAVVAAVGEAQEADRAVVRARLLGLGRGRGLGVVAGLVPAECLPRQLA